MRIWEVKLLFFLYYINIKKKKKTKQKTKTKHKQHTQKLVRLMCTTALSRFVQTQQQSCTQRQEDNTVFLVCKVILSNKLACTPSVKYFCKPPLVAHLQDSLLQSNDRNSKKPTSCSSLVPSLADLLGKDHASTNQSSSLLTPIYSNIQQKRNHMDIIFYVKKVKICFPTARCIHRHSHFTYMLL